MNDATEVRQLRLEPAVDEGWVQQVIGADASPNEFAEWVLARIDLEGWLREFSQARTTGRDTAAIGEFEGSAGVQQARRQGGSANPAAALPEGWTRHLFFDFMEVASSTPDLEWSMALLNAYLELGPMPTSEHLQCMCGFANEYAWQQELRIAKQRLTLHARKMGAPPLFPRAKSAGGERVHPIEPRLFPWLREWANDRDDSEESALPAPENWGPTIAESNKYEE